MTGGEREERGQEGSGGGAGRGGGELRAGGVQGAGTRAGICTSCFLGCSGKSVSAAAIAIRERCAHEGEDGEEEARCTEV